MLAGSDFRAVRLRTDRTDPLRLEMNLENPVAVEFANAREDDDRIKFYSKFGLLFESQWYKRAEEYAKMQPRRFRGIVKFHRAEGRA